MNLNEDLDQLVEKAIKAAKYLESKGELEAAEAILEITHRVLEVRSDIDKTNEILASKLCPTCHDLCRPEEFHSFECDSCDQIRTDATIEMREATI